MREVEEKEGEIDLLARNESSPISVKLLQVVRTKNGNLHNYYWHCDSKQVAKIRDDGSFSCWSMPSEALLSKKNKTGTTLATFVEFRSQTKIQKQNQNDFYHHKLLTVFC